MKFQLSRLLIFLLGIIIMLAINFYLRYHIYEKSHFTHGVLVSTPNAKINWDGMIPMTLSYYVDMKEFKVPVEAPLEIANTAVTVRYLPDKPHNGKIYDFNDFWLISMLWLVVPLMLWTAFLFTAMTPSGKIAIKFEKKRKIPAPDQPKINAPEE